MKWIVVKYEMNLNFLRQTRVREREMVDSSLLNAKLILEFFAKNVESSCARKLLEKWRSVINSGSSEA